MQFRDLKAQYGHLKEEIDNGIRRVLESSAFILGHEVAELETRLAQYVGVEHCVTCANGTDALQLALMAWGVKSGDAVFTSDFTYFASAGSASILGATPVLVDVDARTFNMDPEALEYQIQRILSEGELTPKVIVPVDLFGQPAEYERIEKIAKKYGLRVLEDGAQGFGGRIGNRRACSFGDAATTSFFPAKPLGCYGDGGAVFTNDSEMAERLRSLRMQGRSPEDKYDNRAIGMNSRLDTLQAAILLAKLDAFDEELAAVNQIAEWYTEELAAFVRTPVVEDGYYSSWAQYTILLKDEEERDFVKTVLKEAGIPSMVYYPRGLHQQSAYAHYGMADAWYPNTMAATKTVLSLPMHPYLTRDDVEKITETVRCALSQKRG